jgi:eukaryotic-like serine/threonine-protein kinase
VNPADPFGLIGQVLDGQFRVDKFVGEGGFSIVYRGHHAGLNEPIAIKCLKLPPALGSALVESFIRRFRDESRIHYRLSQGSLAIARSIASGTTMSSSTSALVPYMVLEWLEGKSLAQDFEVRRQQGKHGRSMDEVIKLLDTAAQGLAFAHSQGVVHRDVNPGNLFLAERQQTEHGMMTKVLDFGVAKIISDHALEMGPRAATLGQIRIFAPAYGSPEQFDDTVGKVGPASDVYSFALIVLEALRDLPVREGEHLGEFALMALEPNGRPTPRSLGVPVGDAVEDVFKRAGALRPADRPTDMGQFWGALKHAIRSDAETGKEPHADHVPSRPASSWKPRPPAAGQAPPDRPVTADMPAPIVEVARPGSTAPGPMPGTSQMLRGTVRMQTPPPPQGSGAAALKGTPLTSTLVMESRLPTNPPPKAAALNATLAMASPYARSQSVPQYAPPPRSPPPPAATVAMNSGNAAFAAARAMADAAAAGSAATVAANEGDASFAAARAMADAAGVKTIQSASPPQLRSEVPTVVPPEPKSHGKVIGIVVAALVIVGIAAFAGYRSRMGGGEVPAPAPSATSRVNTAPTAPLPTASAAAPVPAAPAQTATATAAPPESPPAEQPASHHSATMPGGSQASPSTPHATPSPVSTPTPTPAPQAAPTPNPTPTATNPQGFDPNAARAALDVINGVLASCRSPGGKTGDGTINVTFNPDGHADRATVDEPPFTGTPEGACVASRFKQAKIAPFQGAPGSIVYTFHIPN